MGARIGDMLVTLFVWLAPVALAVAVLASQPISAGSALAVAVIIGATIGGHCAAADK